MYEHAKEEFSELYKLDKIEISNKNEEFKRFIYGLDYKKIVDIQVQIYTTVMLLYGFKCDKLLKPDTYFESFSDCLEKICIGYELKNLDKLEYDKKNYIFRVKNYFE